MEKINSLANYFSDLVAEQNDIFILNEVFF